MFDFEGADKLIYSLANQYKRSGSPAELEDLVQEGFLAYVAAMKRFDPSRGVLPTTWVYKRVKGAIHNASRKKWRLTDTEIYVPEEEKVFDAEVSSAEAEALKIEQIEIAQSKIRLLTDNQVHVLHDRVIKGQKVEEIAKSLGMYGGNSVSRIENKALKVLRENQWKRALKVS